MIELSKLSNKKFLVNPDLITCIEDCGDTKLSFLNGDSILVREKPQEVLELIKSSKQSSNNVLATK